MPKMYIGKKSYNSPLCDNDINMIYINNTTIYNKGMYLTMNFLLYIFDFKARSESDLNAYLNHNIVFIANITEIAVFLTILT